MRTIGNPNKEEVRKRMLASGRWKEGPDGSLLRVQAGIPTLERARELERLDRPMTEQEAREYALRAFDPTAGPNVLFSLIAGAHPSAAVADVVGSGMGAAATQVVPIASRAARKMAIRPDEWMEVISDANERLRKGLGIKKGGHNIELVPMDIDLGGSSFPSFDVEVLIDGKRSGHMSFDPITDIDATEIAQKRKALMGDVDPEYGVIRGEDYPFEYNPSLEGQGLSAEMSEAINQALKNKGYRMYSSTSHTSQGQQRYEKMTEIGAVEPIMSLRQTPLPRSGRAIEGILNHHPDAFVVQDRIHIPENRYRFNKEGGRVIKYNNGGKWPPGQDNTFVYTPPRPEYYLDAIPTLEEVYSRSPYEIDPAGLPTISPSSYLTPLGDVEALLSGIGQVLEGNPILGAANMGLAAASVFLPGSIRTGKASEKLAEGSGKKGVSVKSIRQAASGKDVSASEASLLNMLADKAENAGMTHVDPGNMQMGGMQRMPRFRGGNTNPEWDEFFGTDRLMGLDWYNPQNTDAAIREARSEVVRDSDVILLKGDDAIYGTPSSKHFFADRGEGLVPTVDDITTPGPPKEQLRGVGVHAHVRAIPDPWEMTKAKRGEPSRNIRTMLEIQSDAFQSGKRGRWDQTYDFGDEPIYGSAEIQRMLAESPERIEEIFENVEHVGQQVIGYLRDKGFKKGESLQDALGLEKVAEGTGKQQHRNVGLLQDFGGAAVAAPEGEVTGFSKLLEDLIDGGDITRKEADDFLVAYSRFGGEGHYDFNFYEHVTDAEAKGRRMGMADDFDMEVERPNVTREHPWVRLTSELVDMGVNQMRREVKDPDFLKHVEKVKKMPNPSNNPMSKTWEREALAAFFEDGAKKGAEAYRFPTPETVRTIQDWGDNAEFDAILGRYQGLPDQMKKMGVDVSQITPVTDGFGNTWLEIPKDAVPSSVKVFKSGGRMRVKKAKSGMRVKR